MSFVYEFTPIIDFDRNFGQIYLANYKINHFEIYMLVHYFNLYQLMEKKNWCLSNKVFTDLSNIVSIHYAQNEFGPH